MPASNDEDPTDPDHDTGGFQFGQPLKPARSGGNTTAKQPIKELTEEEQEGLLDLVRLEPTSNSELQDQWDLDGGRQVHEYLESHLNPYYYRDEDSYIRVTEEAKDFIREKSGLYQDVTDQPNDSASIEENLRNRDLLMDLVGVAQRLGHLPSEEEIQLHSQYSPDHFRSQFGDLFQACQEAGIVPDSVTREEYRATIESRQTTDEPDPEPASESAADAPDASEETATADETASSSEPSESDGPSREALIEELQWLDETLDRLPYTSDMNEDGAFSAHTYQDEFGSWDTALEAAGIDKEQELLEDMQRVANEVEGDILQNDMNEYGTYSSTMAARYFGSWTDAKDRLEEWQEEQDDTGTEDTKEKFDEKVNDRLDDLLG